MFKRFSETDNLIQQLNVILTVWLSIDLILFDFTTEKAFGDYWRQDFRNDGKQLDGLIVFDFLVDDLKLCFDLRLNGRYELVDKIVMKNRGNYSSFSFPVFTLSKCNASIIEELEDFSKQGMLLKLDGVNHEILDEVGVDGNDLETGECVADDQIVLDNLFFENFQWAMVLFDQFQECQAHEFVG